MDRINVTQARANVEALLRRERWQEGEQAVSLLIHAVRADERRQAPRRAPRPPLWTAVAVLVLLVLVGWGIATLTQ